jgi:hypothetical protein
LQVGGEHEALMLAAPAELSVSWQDSVQLDATEMAPGCDESQVRGILLSTILLFVFGRDELPMTSVIVAKTVCEVAEVPFVNEKLVWPEPIAPTSKAMFWIGHVAKKSRTGDVCAVPAIVC